MNMSAHALIHIVARFNVEVVQVSLLTALFPRINLFDFKRRFFLVWINLRQQLWQILFQAFHALAPNFLGRNDFIKDIWNLIYEFLCPMDFPLVDTEKKFDVHSVNILQQVLAHRVFGLAKGEQTQEWIRALKLAPISIRITARLLRVQHLVLLEL